MSYKRIPPRCPPSRTRAWDDSCNIAWDGLRKMVYWRKGPRVSEKTGNSQKGVLGPGHRCGAGCTEAKFWGLHSSRGDLMYNLMASEEQYSRIRGVGR